ncbi:hypothetical protein BVG16_00520 [Paenibacillus selenitireducens]|uniref:Uncharacterized protein n=1 Tax=Paenibacillus selenitireducens TaxID=1324314 RepID=A0A1T2XLX9_9BACL|nr:hypothetical protein [Paenibacillus selenitireducens]OPA80869.1 hypothetical protein BVG16_00520 [Paenibacillus selenitireducens]
MRTWNLAKSVIYLGIALGMLLFAWPKLNVLLSWSQGTAFVIAWLVLALLIIASQLHFLLIASEKQEAKIQRLRRYRRLQWQQKMTQTLERRATVKSKSRR